MLVDKPPKRIGWLMALSVLHGATIGPLIDQAMEIDPRYFLISYLARHDNLGLDS